MGAEVVGQLTSQWYNDGHDQVRQSGHHSNLRERRTMGAQPIIISISTINDKPNVTEEDEICSVLAGTNL